MGTTRTMALDKMYKTPPTPHNELNAFILAVNGHVFFVPLLVLLLVLPPGATLAVKRLPLLRWYGGSRCC
jgi:hypothetical protein